MLLVGLVMYVVLQFAIGVWLSRRINTDTDYILAGRSLGPTLVAFSVFATWFGAEAIVTTTGEVYKQGLRGGLVDPFAYAAGVILAGLVLAAALWRNGLVTFADLFERRFSPAIGQLAVFVLLPGSLFWAAAQVRAFGQVLSSTADISLVLAITIAAVLVGAYTVIGGLLADSVTDFLQGLVVIAGLAVIVLFVAGEVGGVGGVMAAADPEALVLFGGEGDTLEMLESVAVAVCGTLVAVELVSRFLGARSAEVARLGTVAGGVLYLVIGAMPVFLGLSAAVLVAREPELKTALADSEQVVATLARYYMHGIGYVIFAGALVSAILSNVHSTLHAPAAQLQHNVVLKLKPNLDERQRLLAVRLTVFGLTLVAYVLALTSDRIKGLVEVASAFGSAGVIVATLFGLFTRIGGPASAGAAILTGVGVWAVGKYVLDLTAPYLTAVVCSAFAYLVAAGTGGNSKGRSTT